MQADDVLEAKLRLRDGGAGSEWRVWEHKTLNLHRGVLHWRPAADALSAEEIGRRVREEVERAFRISWWRGFGFGAWVESKAVPRDIAALIDSIDARRNGRGTWQWVILACTSVGVAVGIHTWAAGYLTPVHRGLLAEYEEAGVSVGSFTKEKGPLMQFLTSAARLKGFQFAEFEG